MSVVHRWNDGTPSPVNDKLGQVDSYVSLAPISGAGNADPVGVPSEYADHHRARLGLIQDADNLLSQKLLPLINDISALALPQLQWNFLDFGRGKARVEQAKGGLDEADAQYRQTVLGALKDAEDALTRFGRRRETAAALARVKQSADRSAALTQQRYRAGTATLIDALDAERQRVSADQNLAAATAALTNDYVALQKALGLGWQPIG